MQIYHVRLQFKLLRIIIYYYFSFNNILKQMQIQQISIEKLSYRQIAQAYLDIEENTEFLTHLLRYNHKKSSLQIKPSQITYNLKSIADVIVQVSYLLFTCSIKSTNILLNEHLCRKQKDQACKQYILEKDFCNLPAAEQKIMLKYFKRYEFGHMTQNYSQYVLKNIKSLIDLAKGQSSNVELADDCKLMKQFTDLEDVICNYLQVKVQTVNNARMVILALQQTEIFREHSLLVKIMNNSLFSAIRIHKDNSILALIRDIQSSLIYTKKCKNGQESYLREMQRSIEKLMLLFTEAINQRQNKSLRQRDGQKIYSIGEVQGRLISQRKYYCHVNLYQKIIKDFTPSFMDLIAEQAIQNVNKRYTEKDQNNKGKDNVKNQFKVQFYPGKEMIVIKYITNIELKIENTDFLMFQSNNIGSCGSSVAIELAEKSHLKKGNKKERFIIFKTTFSLQMTQHPLFMIMTMIDLVMLCAKIIEPQIKYNANKSNDFLKLQEISRKIDQMIKIFIKKIQRYYQNFNDSCKNQK